jgi:hypothetical protein
MDGMVMARRLALFGCGMVLVWSIAGLIANPDFAIGDAATSELVLGVDMNGWHAVSGFVVVVPVLLVLNNEALLPWVLLAAAGGLLATAVWAAFSRHVAGGLFYFPNPVGDVLLHLVTASVFFAAAVVALKAGREEPLA